MAKKDITAICHCHHNNFFLLIILKMILTITNFYTKVFYLLFWTVLTDYAEIEF